MNDVSIPILDELRGLADTGGFRIIDNLGTFLTAVIGLALTVAGLATLVYLVWGGIRWLTAGPDKGKVEEARTQLTNAVIGLAVVAASWAVFLLLNYFFGLGIAVGTTGTNTTSGGGRTTQVCLYPARRCCDDVSDSTCFCQLSSYRAQTSGSCPAGGGNTGVYCSCVPR